MTTMYVDFETAFSSDCSLRKLNYFQYLTDPRFAVLGMGYALDEGPVRFVPGPEVEDFLAEVDRPEVIVAHNAMFDGAILTWKYGFKPLGHWADTLSMARALLPNGTDLSLKALAVRYGLGGKIEDGMTQDRWSWGEMSIEEQQRLAEYCVQDIELLRKLYQALAPFPADETTLIDMTLRMMLEPEFQLDAPLAKQLLVAQEESKAKILKESRLNKSQVASNPQFAAWLKAQGAPVPMKVSPRTGKMTYALAKKDEEFKELKGFSPEVDAAIEARLAIKSTLEETRLATLLDTQSRMGAIPIPLKYYGAATGRWSGTVFNAQNLPKGPIRNTLTAPKGKMLVIVDSASIEARVLVWLAGQQDAIEGYKQNKDAYKAMASTIFGVPEAEVTKDQRFLGKTAVLGCIAKGTKILTPRGEVAIEHLLLTDLVWDGENWVRHGGVIDQGEKEVMNYDGLWATRDHKVYVQGRIEPVEFFEAANKVLSLVRSGHQMFTVKVTLNDSKLSTPSPFSNNAAFCGTTYTKTYDILNAGPNHRFTANGRLVSNCGYGVGPNKFFQSCTEYGAKIEFELAELAVKAYREKYYKVVEFWNLCRRQIGMMTAEYHNVSHSSFFPANDQRDNWRAYTPSGERTPAFWFGTESVRLPNELQLHYPNLRMDNNGEYIHGQGKKIKKIWHGLLTENIVQALSRIIIGDQMIKARELGPVVLCVHDEIVLCVPENEAETALAGLIDIMKQPPRFAPGLALGAEGTLSPYYTK